MRLRKLALALALSFGVTGMAEAAAQKPKVQRYKSPKIKKTKIQKTQKWKQSKASKVKPRKAPKRTHR
jgi:hypothetical protein